MSSISQGMLIQVPEKITYSCLQGHVHGCGTKNSHRHIYVQKYSFKEITLGIWEIVRDIRALTDIPGDQVWVTACRAPGGRGDFTALAPGTQHHTPFWLPWALNFSETQSHIKLSLVINWLINKFQNNNSGMSCLASVIQEKLVSNRGRGSCTCLSNLNLKCLF